MEYRREIDGLRAVAVLSVVLFHAGFQTFGGGFVGVDIFFVISGFLITSIILAEKKAGTFSLATFYERRARRILPALFVVLAACIPFAWLWLLPSDVKDFSQSLAAVAVFASNIFFWRTSGYFDAAAALKPLLHTWSLAVEEQYYLLFPAFMVLAWRLGKSWIVLILSLVTVLSLSAAHWGSLAAPVATFYILPTRAWEILVGALVAFYISAAGTPGWGRAGSEVASLVGASLLAFSVLGLNEEVPFPGLYALIPTVGSALVILFATPQTLIGKLLSSQPMVAVGLVSYSAYLWHQPLFAFAAYKGFDSSHRLQYSLLVLLSFVFAYFSWRHVETPFRDRRRFSPKMIFALATAGSVFFATLGLVAFHTDVFPSWYAATPKYKELTQRLRPNYGLDPSCEKIFDGPACRTHEEPEILLWGDSYAMHLVSGLVASDPKVKLLQATAAGCPPILGLSMARSVDGAGECIKKNDQVLEALKASRSIRYVVLASPFRGLGDNVPVVLRDGSVMRRGRETFNRHFLETLKQISALGIKPVVVAPPPQSGANIGNCLLRAILDDENPELCNFSLNHIPKMQKEVFESLRKIEANYKIIWLSEAICSAQRCKASFGDVLVYRDDGHLSYEGSELVGKRLNLYQTLVSDKIQSPKRRD